MLDSAALLAVLLFFAVSLVSERYVQAFASILAIFICAFCWHLAGEELWWRWRLWRRMENIL
jgi:hypothetical protein